MFFYVFRQKDNARFLICCSYTMISFKMLAVRLQKPDSLVFIPDKVAYFEEQRTAITLDSLYTV